METNINKWGKNLISMLTMQGRRQRERLTWGGMTERGRDGEGEIKREEGDEMTERGEDEERKEEEQEMETMPTGRSGQEVDEAAEGYGGGRNDGGPGRKQHLSSSALRSQMAARAGSLLQILVYLHFCDTRVYMQIHPCLLLETQIFGI